MVINIKRKITVFLGCVLASSCILTGCHGAKDSAGFEIPQELDENKKIELTFWAKNDTNVTQTAIYN